MAADRNVKHIRARRQPSVSGGAPAGREGGYSSRPCSVAAMSVLGAVGAFSGDAVALANFAATAQQRGLASTVSDIFDRADGALGSNWTTVSGTAAPQIASDNLRVGTASAVNSAYWSASTFGNNQFAQASCRTVRVLSTGRESPSG